MRTSSAGQPSSARGERVPPAREPAHAPGGRAARTGPAPRPGHAPPMETPSPAAGPFPFSGHAGLGLPGPRDVSGPRGLPGPPDAPGAAAAHAARASQAAHVGPAPFGDAAGLTEAASSYGAAGAPVASPAPGRSDDPAPSPDPADTFVLIDDLLARVRRHRPADCFDELARHRLLERRRLLERHADRRPPHGGPVGWVHGDFHPFNLLYRGDAPAAIVDWDRLGVQPRAEEAVRAAAIFFVRPDGTLDLPKAREYARAYRRTAGASSGELAAAVHRVWWERLNDFWMLRWHYERGDTRVDSQFPASSALAVWWTREYDAVRGAFTD